ncbi:MAG TPA: replication protein [Ignavibacteriales bacterium]|nr:replication protein [Ignavibacteriales bacterium]
MKAGFTAVPNDLFEAALRFKCPAGHKEVIFAVIRLTEGYHKPERAISISYLAKFLIVDRSNVSKRLQYLIKCNVLKETSCPNCIEARHIEINRNFKEWIPGKKVPLKGKTSKKNLPAATEEVQVCTALEFFSAKPTETTTVADSTTPPVVESTTNKDTSSHLSKNKTAAVAVVLKKGGVVKSHPQQQNNGNLEEELKAIFEHSLGRKPNIDEVYELKKQVIKDERFSETENIIILRNAFHRAAICEEAKKHMVYILGIIRSMKQDILKQRDKALKSQETYAAEKPKFTSWEDAGFSLIEDYRRTELVNKGGILGNGS